MISTTENVPPVSPAATRIKHCSPGRVLSQPSTLLTTDLVSDIFCRPTVEVAGRFSADQFVRREYPCCGSTREREHWVIVASTSCDAHSCRRIQAGALKSYEIRPAGR